MSFDTATGIVSGAPSEIGTFPLKISAFNAHGEAKGDHIIVISEWISDAVEIVNSSIRFRGLTSWRIQSQESYGTPTAIRSAPMGDLEESWLELDVEGPDLVSFWWKVGSEEKKDILSVSLDGEVTASISGLVDWEMVSVSVPDGAHTIRWAYKKDYSGSNHEDAAWIDQIELGSESTLPVVISPMEVAAIQGQPFSYQILTLNGPAEIEVTSLPKGLIYDDVSQTITGQSSYSSATLSIGIAATTDAGTYETDLTIQVRSSVAGLRELVGAPSLPWTREDVAWRLDAGQGAARSGAIFHESKSTLITEVTGPGVLKFQWKVSSEWTDYLSLYLDDVYQDRISSEMDWCSEAFMTVEI
jgi:hypothetical protein